MHLNLTVLRLDFSSLCDEYQVETPISFNLMSSVVGEMIRLSILMFLVHLLSDNKYFIIFKIFSNIREISYSERFELSIKDFNPMYSLSSVTNSIQFKF